MAGRSFARTKRIGRPSNGIVKRPGSGIGWYYASQPASAYAPNKHKMSLVPNPFGWGGGQKVAQNEWANFQFSASIHATHSMWFKLTTFFSGRRLILCGRKNGNAIFARFKCLWRGERGGEERKSCWVEWVALNSFTRFFSRYTESTTSFVRFQFLRNIEKSYTIHANGSFSIAIEWILKYTAIVPAGPLSVIEMTKIGAGRKVSGKRQPVTRVILPDFIESILIICP